MNAERKTRKSDEWETPRWLFKMLDEEFNFSLDPACKWNNRKCVQFTPIDLDQDGLKMDWHGILKYRERGNSVFLNMPYSAVYKWLKKAYEESLKGCTVVCLIPASVGSNYFFDIIDPAMRNNQCELRILKGRLKFELNGVPSKGSPYFYNVIVVFGKGRHGTIFVDYKEEE